MQRLKHFLNRVSYLVASLIITGGIVAPNALATADNTSWQNVGAAGFSAGMAMDTSLAFDGNTPYVAYSDAIFDNNDNKITVMKFDGANWVTVGSANFSAGMSQYPSLAINAGTPYVAYADGVNNDKATVMKFDGTNWVTVGPGGFSAGIAYYTVLAIRSDGTPYVAYLDGTNGSKATVMKFDGTNWVTVGPGGFSAGTSNYLSLAMSGATPYVAYADNSNNQRATVMKFDGTNWVTVGAAGFSTDGAMNLSLAISGGTPYLAYTDGANNEATVVKFDGTNWVTVGAAGFSAGGTDGTSLAISGGTPYVSYADAANGYNVTVMGLYTNQKTVSGAVSSLPVTLSTPLGTNITSLAAVASTTNDASYTYPLDLVDFTATVQAGSTNEVILTFQTGLKPNEVTARKYNSATNKYADIPGTTITETTVNGKHALQLTYNVTDGGALDQDGTVNGVIVDPVGLGTTATTTSSSSSATTPKTPDTGYGVPSRSDPLVVVIGVAAALSMGGGLALLYHQKRSKNSLNP